MNKTITLQNVVFEDFSVCDETRGMYYRGTGSILKTSEGYYFQEDNYFDFSTYYNSLSAKKWMTYTYAHSFCIEIEYRGKLELNLMGHYVNNHKAIKKEWLGQYLLESEEYSKICIPFPEFYNSSVLCFQLKTMEDTYIKAIDYIAEIDEKHIKAPFITLATTTFKKENYIKKNIELLKKTLFADEELAKHFSWKIVDNGRTLDPKAINNENIEVVPNKNVGGSGGFSCGMITALGQKKRPTHILLMDDDVELIPESFKRVYRLLSMVREEYENHFISGAMLEIHERNVQHEDVGYFSLDGAHGPAKPRYDLNRWDSVILNEEFLEEDEHHYSGWWYCCIPTTIAIEDNLPLPLFVRGDDVEYSIRNHAKFISMNGICIWHEGFGTKFSGSLELYQVHRNDLIIQAIQKEEMGDIKIIERISTLFWEELYKFNYKGANLLLDAVEDYLKGPEYIQSLNGEACMKEMRGRDNVLLPITPEIEKHVNRATLYEWKPLGSFEKRIYDYSCNGQRLPKAFCKNGIGVIPYGWGYYQEKMYLTEVNYAIDPINNLYVEYRKSNTAFKQAKARFTAVMNRYQTENHSVEEAYRNAEKKFESISFWKSYLK